MILCFTAVAMYNTRHVLYIIFMLMHNRSRAHLTYIIHMYYVWLFCIPEELLLNRQVKSYSFLSGGAVGVDDVDDSEMFKMTEVS